MSEREFDVVVVGMGPGGEYIATKLAAAGLAVAAVEQNLVGGECPFWACNPSKMMIRAGNVLAEGRRVPGMAGTSMIVPDWAPVADRIRDEATHDWTDKLRADRFTGLGGTLYRGHGMIAGPETVRVGDSVLRAGRGRGCRAWRRASRTRWRRQASRGPGRAVTQAAPVPPRLGISATGWLTGWDLITWMR